MYIHKNGEILPATLIFDFEQITSAIVVRLDETFFTKQQEYFLQFDYKNKRWIELNNRHITEPVFFGELLKQLNTILTQAETKIIRSHTKPEQLAEKKKSSALEKNQPFAQCKGFLLIHIPA
jgi:hypothetical protein